ncbi:nicotinate-nucleotide adenylyltransferase [Romeria aff. gracilis LEGE 07310]|uniref:Probable nicotinate-nucleotide adenylyltransferase n=2 Tax=Vasconcelosia TaxID=3366328 RepID=A0A8J7DDX8_9CYAN|nr:nicotinate-nucleotide adenylyltransferase [Romeria aff. gracilis LEGE 07310]
MNIALFGTSADPPHRGHQAILQRLAGQFDQVAVWTADNPFKSHRAAFDHRQQMLSLLIDSLDPSAEKVRLYPELSDRYTVNSLKQARQIWPEANFSLVVGADLVAQLPQWYRAQEIFRQVQIWVFPRPGYPLNEADLAELRQRGADVAIAQPPELYDVSSSGYRETDNSEQLPPAVQAYIHDHHLYPCPENSKKKQPTRS